MPWQLAISLSMMAFIILALIQRHYSVRSKAPSSFPPAVSYILGVMPLGIVAGLLLPHHIDWTWNIAIILIGNSVTIGVGNWMLFSAIRRMPLVELKVINQFSSIAAIILGWVFLGEGLNSGQTVGAVLLFTAALLAIIASKRRSKEKIKLSGPVIVATIGALLFGSSLVIEKVGLGHMDIGAWLIFGWGAQTLAMVTLALKDVSKHTIRNFGRSEIKWSAIMGIASGTAGVLYIVALIGSDNISLILTLMALALPLIAIGAYVILKERENLWLLWTSVILSTIGLIFMNFH